MRRNLEMTRGVRIAETSSVILFWLCEIALAVRVWPLLDLSPAGWLALLAGSFLLADFVSGLFHWAADTWGSPEMPVIGGLFVRPFRDHHIDEMGITRHDFFEVTGANCAIALPWFLVHLVDLERSPNAAVGATFLGAFLFFVFLTALSHRWAHSETPPALAKVFQKTGLLLSPELHKRHHEAPHTSYYCITSGALNPVLDKARFFRALEVIVASVTGLVPREDEGYADPAALEAPAPERDTAS